MHKNTFIALFFNLFIFWITPTSAQNPNWFFFDSTSTPYLYTYMVWNIDNDLENNYYIGTGHGLLKFNFTNWELYNSSNSPIPANEIPSVLVQNNTKWIGTLGGGLVKWEGNNWTIFNTTNSGIPDNAIDYLALDNYSNIWLGTRNKGVVIYDGLTWTVFDTINSGIPNNYPRDIDIDNNNVKWICTSKGLAKFDGNNWTIYNSANSGLPSNAVDCLAIDNNNNKWIGTRESYSQLGDGIAKFDGNNWIIYNISNSGLPDNSIKDIAIDLNGNVWIGTSVGGLAKFDGINWTVFNTTNSPLPVNMIERIFVDQYNNKWITTYSQQYPLGYLLAYNENGVTNIDYPVDNLIPNEIKLSQNYPNPFNPNTAIRYSISSSAKVSIKIYDVSGQLIKEISQEHNQAGDFEVIWDGKNSFGERVSSGNYFYQLSVGEYVEAKKMILIK